MRLLHALEAALFAQRGSLMHWVPVCLGAGIAWYFGMKAEPGLTDYAVLAGVGILSLVVGRLLGGAFGPLFLALGLVMAGVLLAGYKAHAVAGPVLSWRYYGPIEGRVIEIDRSQSDAPRLTLDRVHLDRVAPDRTPLRVRVSLHGTQRWLDPVPGMIVGMTGHLSPPSGPVEPGGFDFQRNAWFEGLGAVGYTRDPAVALALPEGDPGLWVYRQRMAISAAVQRALPGQTGAFAAALMTGDRAGLNLVTLSEMRAANLAHLLAISGLHMGILTAFVFGLVRTGLSLWPAVALRLAVKKIAAVVALAVGAAYLALSGASVATERAFIMVAVMLVAVLVDRRALTLRAVAMAATILLVLHPETLMGPGFQMSFAATTALVAVFGAMRGREAALLPRWMRPVVAVVASSLIAGLATAPFAAAHFNQVSHFGLLANLACVPLMGLWVMPMGVLATCLAPFGAAGIGLWLMNWGLRWILAVAHAVAGWPGAVGHVVSPGEAVLPLLTVGLLWLALWRGRARWAGAVVAAGAFVLWSGAERPALLIADSGALMGQMTPEGRVLSKASGDGFAATSWLENDGAPVPQDRAAARPGLQRAGRAVSAEVGAAKVLLVTGKTGLAAVQGCGGAQILVTNMVDDVARPCRVYDLPVLRRTGALSIRAEGDGLRVVTARDVTGERLWNGGAAQDRWLLAALWP